MKEIKLIDTNKEKIESAIKDAEGRASARTVDYYDIVRILNGIEKELGFRYRSQLDGISIHYTGAREFPKAYKYRPDSTHFHARHNGKCWYITNIYRSECPNSFKGRICVSLTDDQKNKIISRYTYL